MIFSCHLRLLIRPDILSTAVGATDWLLLPGTGPFLIAAERWYLGMLDMLDMPSREGPEAELVIGALCRGKQN